MYCGAVRPQHNGRGRRLDESYDRTSQQPGYPRWPLLRRKRHHRGRNRRSSCRPGLHLRACSGCGRDFADTADKVPQDRCLLPHRSRGWTYLAASGGHEVFLRRPFGAGAKPGWATQGVPQPDLFEAKVGGTAWKSKPSWYIVGKKDRTVHPDLERAMAKRMGATTYELDSSHVPMLSQPERVIDVIRAAAKAIQGSSATS